MICWILQGPIGLPGLTGLRGYPGSDGPPGLTGLQGLPGSAGRPVITWSSLDTVEVFEVRQFSFSGPFLFLLCSVAFVTYCVFFFFKYESSASSGCRDRYWDKYNSNCFPPIPPQISFGSRQNQNSPLKRKSINGLAFRRKISPAVKSYLL